MHWRDEEFIDAIADLRASLQRPVGKTTYEIADQRAFDAAVEKLYAAAEIEPLGA